MTTLNTYLETLTNEESAQKTASAHFASQPVEDLVKTAGIKLAANVCHRCMTHMTKTGSVYRCDCGMVKKAPKAPKTKTAKVKLSRAQTVEVVFQLNRIHEGDLVKVAAVCEAAGMEKEAIMPILKALGNAAKGAWQAGSKAYGASAAKAARNLKGTAVGAAGKGPGMGTHLLEGAKAALPAAGKGLKQVGKVTKEYGKGIGKAYGKMREGGAGRFQSALGAGVAAPGAAATALGAGGLAAYQLGKGRGRQGAMEDIYLPKQGSVEVLEIGDGAGRILAKMATPIPMDELQESLQEARSREDIAGRGNRWAAGGGALGALGGGAGGYGLGRLIGPKAGLIGAGIGALGGGAGGAALGRGHGQEEARADKAISMLRALRAHRMGASSGARAGYMAGMKRGYGMRPKPGAGGEAPDAGGQAKVGSIVRRLRT